MLAHVSAAAGAKVTAERMPQIYAADLTARLLTREKYDVLARVLAASYATRCPVILLKGVAAAIRYYPAPHLRGMGDIDCLVPADLQPAFEDELRGLGFRQCSDQPPEVFVGRHHSMPFRDPTRNVWIDVHTALHPRQFPLARDAAFSPNGLTPDLTPIEIDGRTAYTMNHERQLVYTSSRWAELIDPYRGAFPLLDVALLLKNHGHSLDWDRVCAIVKGSWAATALHLMLLSLLHLKLARIPVEVLSSLGAADRHTSRVSSRLLDHLLTAYVVEGRPGPVLTEGNLGIIWSTIVGPGRPFTKIVSLPYYLAFPPSDPRRFSPTYACRRFRKLVRRSLWGANAA